MASGEQPRDAHGRGRPRPRIVLRSAPNRQFTAPACAIADGDFAPPRVGKQGSAEVEGRRGQFAVATAPGALTEPPGEAGDMGADPAVDFPP